ncbi:VapE domain-containing protein [Caballeronia sp. dw_276]|uniref:VapE domain-containing protein n=1 Tax=Caballeronia sp. dw_276 TaxID=2719795 RepID=UPI001BD6B081|nr:VapE domain-containing protein [Caballeronia sp. dw_276]
MATIDQIIQQLDAAGHPKLPDGHPIADGKPHRYGPRKKYWYSAHEVEKAGRVIGYTGAFGHWSGDDNGATTFMWQGDSLSPDDIAATRARQRETERVEEERRVHKAKLAANRAASQWQEATSSGTSEYLDRKQITPEGVRFDSDGTLFVPMFRYGNGVRLVGLQKITPSGAKRFNAGMEKKGAAFQLGEIEHGDKVAMVAEGYATGRSIRMATDERIPLFVCFDAGGIMDTAAYLRDRHHDLHVLICADDDWKLEQRLREHLLAEYAFDGELTIDEVADPVSIKANKTAYMLRAAYRKDEQGIGYIELAVWNDVMPERLRRFENTGLKRAYEAAAAIGNASVVYPVFANREDRKLTDFNDLHVDEGLHVVKAQIEAGLLAALAPSISDIPAFPHLHAVDPGEDPLFNEAVAFVRKGARASVSALQRQLRIGVNRAARLIEAMEAADVVSAPSSNNVRTVIRLLGAEHADSAGADDEGLHPNDPANDVVEWQHQLRRAEKSHALLPCLDNVFAILTNDPRWKGVFGFEQFSLRVMKLKPPPFEGGEVGEWTDRDDARCVLWLGQFWSFSPRSDVVMDAVFLIADRNRYHEVRDYLDALQWDRVERLRSWLITYLGVEDSEYVRLAGFKWLLGAIGRVMQPGCKMDNVLILEGVQDAGKSAAFRTLFSPQWFTDANIVIGDKDAFAVMAGKWVIELAELDALSKSDSSNAKRFFTTAVDTYRPPYAKRAIDVPRQSVFAGTVNFDTYLKDESGNRRYWPVKASPRIRLKELAADRDQIWAEAYTVYVEWHRANSEAEGLLPTPWQVLPTEKHLFSAEQEARYEGDIYETMIAKHIAVLSRITMQDILGDCLKLEISKWTPAEQRRVGKALKSIGWIRKRESSGTREWYYTAPDPIDDIEKPVALANFQRAESDDDAPL